MNAIRKWQFFAVGILLLFSVLPVAHMDSDAEADESSPHLLTLWRDGDSCERLDLRGRVVNQEGRPVEGAIIDLRQADGTGEYTAQYQGSVTTDDRGSFSLRTAVPGQYTSAKHIHIRVTHADHAPYITEILFKGDPNIDFGTAGGLEVLLEQIHKGSDTMSVGGVEITLP